MQVLRTRASQVQVQQPFGNKIKWWIVLFVKKSEIESTFVDDRKLINLQKLSAREKEKSLIPANIK